MSSLEAPEDATDEVDDEIVDFVVTDWFSAAIDAFTDVALLVHP